MPNAWVVTRLADAEVTWSRAEVTLGRSEKISLPWGCEGPILLIVIIKCTFSGQQSQRACVTGSQSYLSGQDSQGIKKGSPGILRGWQNTARGTAIRKGSNEQQGSRAISVTRAHTWGTLWYLVIHCHTFLHRVIPCDISTYSIYLVVYCHRSRVVMLCNTSRYCTDISCDTLWALVTTVVLCHFKLVIAIASYEF